MGDAWMVRAGSTGEREKVALEEGLAIAGWEEVGDLSHVATRPALREVLEQAYPSDSRATIGNWTGQMWRLLHEIKIGDLIVLPLKSQPGIIAVGRVVGNYQYRGDANPGFRHVRQVHWLRVDLSRSDVRQDLLDSMGSLLTVCRLSRFGASGRIAQLAEGGIDPGPPGGDGTEIDSVQALAAQAAAATPENPLRLTIRDLLSCWGVVRRTPNNVVQIEADLAELGLTTRPPFTEGWIDTRVEVLAVGVEPADAQDGLAARDVRADDVSDFPPITLRIDVLRSANTGVMSVRPEDEIRVASTKMIAYNYSQLAVIDDGGELHGAISWETIGMAQIAAPIVNVSSATSVARVVDYHEDLLGQIGEIYRTGYVFVRAPDRSIAGVVTAADLTERFGELVRPLVLIEEAERRLRRRVDEVFGADEISLLTKKRAKSAMAMTIGNYPYVLKADQDWRKLGWNLDHQVFLGHLDEVRKIRNEFMHFSPDQVNDEQMSWLEGFVRLLRTVDTRP